MTAATEETPLEALKYSSLRDTEFALGDVEYRVLPVPYAEGKHIVDSVRVTLSRLKDATVSDGGDAQGYAIGIMLEMLSMLTIEERQDLDDRLFKYLEAKLPGTEQYVRVRGNEAAVFKANIFHSYVALVRAFCAGFLDSLQGVLSMLGVDAQDLLRSAPPMSTPISPQ